MLAGQANTLAIFVGKNSGEMVVAMKRLRVALRNAAI
jgi:hypothetical protein